MNLFYAKIYLILSSQVLNPTIKLIQVEFILSKGKCKKLFWFDNSDLNFLTFPVISESQLFFSDLNYNCSNVLDLKNLEEQVKN